MSAPLEDCDPGLAALFARAFAPVEQAVGAAGIPGAALGMVDLDHGTAAAACGRTSVGEGARDVDLDTWFDLASLSKVLFTTPRILAHHLAGAFDLDDPLTKVLPEIRQFDLSAWERRVTFREALGHNTPFPADVPLFTHSDNPQLLRAHILQRKWEPIPGPVYTCVNYLFLGLALERLERRRIREMDPGHGFCFVPPPGNVASTEFCPWRNRMITGEVHDENCSALEGAGNAGLFGGAASMISAARALLEGAASGDPAVALQRQPVRPTRTLGWESPWLGWSGGDLCAPSVIGHTGFTGTGLWLDFDRRRAWFLLTNRVHPSRYGAEAIFALRRLVGDIFNAG